MHSCNYLRYVHNFSRIDPTDPTLLPSSDSSQNYFLAAWLRVQKRNPVGPNGRILLRLKPAMDELAAPFFVYRGGHFATRRCREFAKAEEIAGVRVSIRVKIGLRLTEQSNNSGETAVSVIPNTAS